MIWPPRASTRCDNPAEKLLNAQPLDGDSEVYKSIVVVFTDLSLDQAEDFFDEVLHVLAAPSYEDDGIVMGSFYDGNSGTAIYNSHFRPFTSAGALSVDQASGW